MTEPGSEGARERTLMWEAKAADDRADELVAHVLAHSDPAAQVFRSRDGRVVLIDPSGAGPADVPEELLARPAHGWRFTPVARG